MKKLLLGLLLFFSLGLEAQECSYEVNEVNKFDGKVQKITTPIVIAEKVERKRALNLRKVMAHLKNYDGECRLALKFPMTAIMTPTFKDDEAGNRLILLLEDNSKLELPLADLMDNNREKIEARYGADFLLEKATLSKLKKNLITDMRVALNNNTFEFSVLKSAAQELQKSLDCL